MIDKIQLRAHIIRPAISACGLWSREAEELLIGTCAHESKLGTFVVQKGGGPALGIFQMEPATHADIWDNFLAFNPALTKRIGNRISRDPYAMVYDMQHACIMARLQYYRVREQLPRADLIDSQARYWKKYYNTMAGKGTVDQYIADYNHYVA